MLPVVRVFCHAVFLCTSFVVARFPASAAHAASSPPTLTLVPPLPVVATLAPQQQDAAGSATERQSDLVILHINDFHGQFRPLRGPRPRGGVLALAREVREQRRRAVERGATFWMTDGGDWFQGTPEGNTSKGRLVVDLQRELGLDFATLGNHEFDFGSDNVRALVARARHPVLAANVVRKDGIRPPWLRSHVVRTVRGVRIALIGLVTKDTRVQSTGPFGGFEFEDELDCLTRELPRVARESDAVVLLTHCGFEKDREIAARFPQVRLILGGHSHTSLKEPVRVGDTTIVQTGGKASEYYLVQLRVDATNKTIEIARAVNRALVVETPSDQQTADPGTDEQQGVAHWIQEHTRDIAAEWDAPVGALTRPLEGARGVTVSTTAGNLLSDLIREAGSARIGVMNRGGIRTSLPAGVVTKRDVYELLPFTNDVVSMDLLGGELRTALSEGLATAHRPFEVSGIGYEILEPDTNPRIGKIWLLPEKVELDETMRYRVATNSFLAGGGDGAHAFTLGTERRRHPVLLRDLLLEALAPRDEEGSPIPVAAPDEPRIVLR
ncbi:MAG: bifunctional metallophosphatase/5'-nucleotidase [Planctomycetes bacterium]|nr:bifunctional metallophosphatase/5'-nucleotidase [Planctomycetota bacterium]